MLTLALLTLALLLLLLLLHADLARHEICVLYNGYMQEALLTHPAVQILKKLW